MNSSLINGITNKWKRNNYKFLKEYGRRQKNYFFDGWRK